MISWTIKKSFTSRNSLSYAFKGILFKVCEYFVTFTFFESLWILWIEIVSVKF